MNLFSEETAQKLHEAYCEMHRKYTEAIAEELCGKRVTVHEGTAILDKDGDCTIYAIYGFRVVSVDVYDVILGVTDDSRDYEDENIRLLPSKIEING